MASGVGPTSAIVHIASESVGWTEAGSEEFVRNCSDAVRWCGVLVVFHWVAQVYGWANG
jgi:hypothetical protein